MTNIVVVGMQWGDEGKGKIVDLISPAFHSVARYQGGHNAGHTVKFGNLHFALHLIPSGILNPDLKCYLGNGMVIHPDAFLKELDGLREAGVQIEGRLFISDRAQLLVQAHGALDQAREHALGKDKIGTTARGIGPAYEAKVRRSGLRICDLRSEELEAKLARQLSRIGAELEDLGFTTEALLSETLERFQSYEEQLRPFVTDVSRQLNEAIDSGERILFEGAQGTLLDIDHGTYPYVTSSNSTSGGACTGTGVPPTRIGGVLGILKAYTTRVGEGPFPTELHDEAGKSMQELGNEYGTTTGRPRRCGWLDLVIGRYAQRINGIGSIALTKLDVLDELDEIKVCVAYRIDGEEVRDLPADGRLLAAAEPIYETLPGWQSSTVGLVDWHHLPEAAQRYVGYIEQQLGTPVDLISTGPKREETIVLSQALGDWLGIEGMNAVTVRRDAVMAG